MKILSSMDIPHQEQCGLKVHGTATIGKKWQIVIPKEARELLWLSEGDTLVVMSKKDLMLWLIRNDDIPTMMEYMQEEMNAK